AIATSVASVKTTNAGTLSAVEISFRQITSLSKTSWSYVAGHSWQRPILRSAPVVKTSPQVRHLATLARRPRRFRVEERAVVCVLDGRMACRNREGLRLARPPPEQTS